MQVVDSVFVANSGIVPETEVKDRCCHHWIIESPNGPNSKGVCKFCNQEREFANSLLRYDLAAVTLGSFTREVNKHV